MSWRSRSSPRPCTCRPPAGGRASNTSALLAGALTCALLVTTWGGREYAWGSPEILGTAAAAVALLVAFVAQERRAPEPILPLRLLRDPVFDIVALVLFLTTCALFAAMVFMPLFLQIVTGASATRSGLLLLPMLVTAAASTAISGRLISRTGRYKIFPVAGLGLMAVGLLLLAQLDAASSRATASAYLAVFGLGFGMVSQALVIAIQNGVDRADLGIATAASNLFRSFGGSAGVALFGGPRRRRGCGGALAEHRLPRRHAGRGAGPARGADAARAPAGRGRARRALTQAARRTRKRGIEAPSVT